MKASLNGKVGRYPKECSETVRAISEVFDTSITATAIRLVKTKNFSAVLVCHGMNGRKWFTRSPEVPDRWFPRRDLCPESFVLDGLVQDKPDDRFPRKIGADAWFDRWDSGRYEVHEQTARPATGSDTLSAFDKTGPSSINRAIIK